MKEAHSGELLGSLGAIASIRGLCDPSPAPDIYSNTMFRDLASDAVHFIEFALELGRMCTKEADTQALTGTATKSS